MQFSLQNHIPYKKALIHIAVITFFSAFGCVLLSYLFLPLASAFYAALLFYESKSKRIFSYAIPIIILFINVLLNGFYSFEGAAYVLVGLVVYFLCKKGFSKAETVFWLSLLIIASFVLSAIFLGIRFKSSVGASGIVEYYSYITEMYKHEFIDFLTSIVVNNEDGIPFFAFNPIEAEAMFNELIILLIPTAVLISILLCGISLKIFSSIIKKYSGEDCGIGEWRFKTTNFVAYFYIILAVVSFFLSNDGSIFTYVLISLNMIFAPIYAYLGVTVVHALIVSHGKSSAFSIMIIVISCIVFYSFAITLLSFIGVYFTIAANRITFKNN